MPLSKPFQKFLDAAKAKYSVVSHKTVYTAYDLAQTTKTDLKAVAKTLLAAVDMPGAKRGERRMVVAVLPADKRLDIEKLRKALKASAVTLVNEKGMAKMGLVPGALTPFGAVRGFEVAMEKALVAEKKVLAGCESFEESLHLSGKELARIAQPAVIASFGQKSGLKLQKPKKAPAKKGKKPKAKMKAKPATKKPVKKAAKPAKKTMTKSTPAKKVAKSTPKKK